MKKMMNIVLVLALTISGFAQAESLKDRLKAIPKPTEVSVGLKAKLQKITEAATGLGTRLNNNFQSVPSDTRIKALEDKQTEHTNKLAEQEKINQENADAIVATATDVEQLKVDTDNTPEIIAAALKALLPTP